MGIIIVDGEGDGMWEGFGVGCPEDHNNTRRVPDIAQRDAGWLGTVGYYGYRCEWMVGERWLCEDLLNCKCLSGLEAIAEAYRSGVINYLQQLPSNRL